MIVLLEPMTPQGFYFCNMEVTSPPVYVPLKYPLDPTGEPPPPLQCSVDHRHSENRMEHWEQKTQSAIFRDFSFTLCKCHVQGEFCLRWSEIRRLIDFLAPCIESLLSLCSGRVGVTARWQWSADCVDSYGGTQVRWQGTFFMSSFLIPKSLEGSPLIEQRPRSDSSSSSSGSDSGSSSSSRFGDFSQIKWILFM